MTIYLYNRETSLEIYQLTIYSALKELGFPVTLTNSIDISISATREECYSDDIYIIIGGQYLLEPPQKYIVVQTLPTSHLTKVNKLEAYWMTKEYITLLEKAVAVWDFSADNIKVWENYYGFNNVKHLVFGYQSIITDRIKSLQDKSGLGEIAQINNYNTQTTSYVVIGDDRADKWLKSLSKRDIDAFNLTIRSAQTPFPLITGLIGSGCGVIIIADYENTYPDISMCYALRYNGVRCLVEKPRDIALQKSLLEIGCELVPWIRLNKHFKNTLQALGQSATKMPKRHLFSSNLDTSITNDLIVYRRDSEKIDGDEGESNNKKTNNKRKRKTKAPKLYTREPVGDVNYDLLEDGGISLKLGDIPDLDLPTITICTPTGNRRSLFSLAIRNFMNFIYPEDKLRWLILDDGEKSMEEIIPRDYRIRYQFIGGKPERLSVAAMRNRLVELSNTEIILFMDDDDYYPPENILARTKSLIKYKKEGVQCVGCRDVASYDLKQGLCAICSNGEEYLTESSLAFTKDFWRERPFREADRTSEYRYFLEYRQDKMRSIPFQFVTIALTHGSNTTGGVRDLDFYRKWQPSEDWEATKKSILNILDEETQDFLNMLKKII